MKQVILLLAAILTITSQAQASDSEFRLNIDCLPEGGGTARTVEWIGDQVKKAQSCDAIYPIVQFCGAKMGQAVLAEAMIELSKKCSPNSLSQSDLKLKKTMEEKCDQICKPRGLNSMEDGHGACENRISVCKLNVDKYFYNLN